MQHDISTAHNTINISNLISNSGTKKPHKQLLESLCKLVQQNLPFTCFNERGLGTFRGFRERFLHKWRKYHATFNRYNVKVSYDNTKHWEHYTRRLNSTNLKQFFNNSSTVTSKNLLENNKIGDVTHKMSAINRKLRNDFHAPNMSVKKWSQNIQIYKNNYNMLMQRKSKCPFMKLRMSKNLYTNAYNILVRSYLFIFIITYLKQVSVLLRVRLYVLSLNWV